MIPNKDAIKKAITVMTELFILMSPIDKLIKVDGKAYDRRNSLGTLLDLAQAVLNGELVEKKVEVLTEEEIGNILFENHKKHCTEYECDCCVDFCAKALSGKVGRHSEGEKISRERLIRIIQGSVMGTVTELQAEAIADAILSKPEGEK
jgi:hypothetical protein